MKKKKTFQQIMINKFLEAGISKSFIDSNMEFIDSDKNKKDE